MGWKPTWVFHGLPKVQRYPGSELFIGNAFKATSSWRHNSIGVFQPVILKTVRPTAILRIGNNVGISGSTISSTTSIFIGDNVLIGSGCLITDSDAHPLHDSERSDPKKIGTHPIHIGNNVFIGARATILKGVTLGEGCVIGAGSVVTTSIPPRCVAAGNPAKVIREIN
jgi:acetyltransferase-like isoleucine patch superfamily enzyme